MTNPQEQRRSVIYNALVTFGAVFFSIAISMPFTTLQLFAAEYPCADQEIVINGTTGVLKCDNARSERILSVVNTLNATFWVFLLGGGYAMLAGIVLGLNIRFEHRDPVLILIGVVLAVIGFLLYLWVRLFIS